jgi:hypothetical protein
VSKDQEVTNLEQLLDRVGKATQGGGRVSLGAVLDVVGRRSFGPLLLLAGLVTLAPIIGDIPGVPTIMAVLVWLIAGQLLFRREHIWLPRWLLERSVAPDKLRQALKWLRRPARFIDRLLRPRLAIVTHPTAVAIVCLVIAAAMPAMEVVPFSANIAGAALTAFGLALIAHDGLMALLAFVMTAMIVALVVYHLL